jgi:subtilisin-like proprotein convertase family protein
MKMRCVGVGSALVLASMCGIARAQSFAESFDSVAGLSAAGWHIQNNSDPLGAQSWFQGVPGFFPPYATTGYISVNFQSTASLGTISNWLVTPAVTISNGDEVRFWTRQQDDSIWPDRLELRMSTQGNSTNVGSGALDVGDFTALLLSVNPDLTPTGYPTSWTVYTATISGLPAPAMGRFALRYFVTEAGSAGNNSSLIGVDEFQFGVGGIPTGACCFSNGACSVLSVHECAVRAGEYQGNGSECTSCVQPPSGACCMANGTCSVVTPLLCTSASGVYLGDNSACTACPSNYAYTGQPILIPDGLGEHICGDPAIAEVIVQDSFTVGAVHAAFTMQHGWQGDVKVMLRHVPSGRSAVIHDRPGVLPGVSEWGFSAENFGTLTIPFRTSETGPKRYNRPDITAGINNATGTWRPDNPLSVFAGVNSAGAWRLEVQDCFDGYLGMLESFTLSLEPGGAPPCYANCDGSTTPPILNVEDFTCFINKFAEAQALPPAQQLTHYANCDQSTTSPVLNVEDFTCFINKFAQGCP